MTRALSFTIVLAASALYSPMVGAQEYALSTGFQPDPHVQSGQSGGPVQASSQQADCRGWIQPRPNHVFVARTPFNRLRIFATSTGDTTLLIRLPNGTMLCNDDTFGRDPSIDFAGTSPAGRYEIFVGSYIQNEANQYQLVTTEIQATPESLGGGNTNANTNNNQQQQQQNNSDQPVPNATEGARICGRTQAGREGCVDATSPRTNFGCRGGRQPCAIRSGFVPDPQTYNLTAGGGRDPVQVGSLNIVDARTGEQCRQGYVTPRPDFRFVFTAGQRFNFLRFYVTPVDEGDPVLLVATPDGRWRCNDDSFGGLNPSIDFANPPAGQYDVWVGSYQQGARGMRATFNVTELENNHP